MEKNRAKKIGNEWLAIHYQYTTIFSYFIVSTLQGRIKAGWKFEGIAYYAKPLRTDLAGPIIQEPAEPKG